MKLLLSVSALVVLCGLGWGDAALAQPAPEGKAVQDKEHAELLDVKASALFKTGDVRAALPLYQEAYRAYPNDNSAWNIARCYEELGELHEAVTAFKLFQKLPGLSDKDRAAADEHIATLLKEIASWREQVELANKQLEQRAIEPAQALWEGAIRRPVEPPALLELTLNLSSALEESDKLPQAQRVLERYLALDNLSDTLRSRAQRALEALEKRAAPEPAPQPAAEQPAAVVAPAQPARPPQDGASIQRIAGWSLVAVGVGGLGFGTYQALKVNDVNRRIPESLEDPDVTRSELDALEDEASQAELLQYIGFGVGGAALIGGLLMVFLDDDEVQETSRAQRWSLGVSRDQVSVQVEW